MVNCVVDMVGYNLIKMCTLVPLYISVFTEVSILYVNEVLRM